jgi:hypothetical protein
VLVSGADYDVMLDASGSMRGFKIEEATWRKFLNRFESSAIKKYQFGDKNNFKLIKNASLFEVRLIDQATYLGEALQDWLKESAASTTKVVIIITDNVVDTGGSSSKSQQLFYELLSKPDSPFSHIAIFPIILPFKGKVFPIGSNNGRRYKGDRALSLYLIAKDFSDEAFKKLRSSIQTKLTGFDNKYIQIKPFDSESVSGLVGDIEIDPDDAKGASVKFETDADGKKRLVVRGLHLGKEIKFSFKVNVKSSNSFELQNVELLGKIQLFTDDQQFKKFKMTDNFSAKVSPRRATISPKGLQNLTVEFQSEAFDFGDLGFFEKLVFTMQNNMLIQGNLELQFKASRENMKLSQGITQTWSYEGAAADVGKPDAEIQKKVYKLGDLVKSMLPETNEIQKLHSVPLTLELRYPLWPLLVVFVGCLLFFGLIYLLLSRAAKEYILEDGMGQTTNIGAIGFAQSYPHYSEDGQKMFSLTALGIGFLVRSSFHLDSSSFISSGQDIRISDDSGEEYSWQLREETKEPRDSGDYDFDDDFDDD